MTIAVWPKSHALAETSLHPTPTGIAEVLGMLSFALDMTEGQSPGHTLRGAWIGAHVAQAMGLDAQTQSDLLHTQLLKDAGCSSNAAMISTIFRTDDIAFKRDFRRLDGSVIATLRFLADKIGAGMATVDRLRMVAKLTVHRRNLLGNLSGCRATQGADIARTLGMPKTVLDAIQGANDHWDGTDAPTLAKDNSAALLSNIALISDIVDVFHETEGTAAALREVTARRGSWFRPDVADALNQAAQNPALWAGLLRPDMHRDVLQLPAAMASGPATNPFLDTLAEAFSQIIDAKSSFTTDHSRRVAHYADVIASELGLSSPHRRLLRRAALLHDLGKLSVSNQILDKPSALNDDEWKVMRDHPLRSEQILRRVPEFQSIATIAGAHHERIDGKGYPYGRGGSEIPLEARILSVAIVFDALSMPRPHRSALPTSAVLALLDRDRDKAFDAGVVAALRSGLIRLRARAS